MEVWLTKNGDRLRLPITPFFEIEYGNNNTRENLNEVGTINISGNKGLRQTEITSFFPSKKYTFLESSDTNLDPYYYVNKLEQWAMDNNPIRLIITETPHNFEVLIDNFKTGEIDGTGDVDYTLTLSEYRRVVAQEVQDQKKILNGQLPRAVALGIPALTMLKVGRYDTAWTMAKKIFGDGEKFKDILKKNKSVKPGEVLKL